MWSLTHQKGAPKPFPVRVPFEVLFRPEKHPNPDLWPLHSLKRAIRVQAASLPQRSPDENFEGIKGVCQKPRRDLQRWPYLFWFVTSSTILHLCKCWSWLNNVFTCVSSLQIDEWLFLESKTICEQLTKCLAIVGGRANFKGSKHKDTKVVSDAGNIKSSSRPVTKSNRSRDSPASFAEPQSTGQMFVSQSLRMLGMGTLQVGASPKAKKSFRELL